MLATEVKQEGNRRTFRFKPSHDVLLLREIARLKPWAALHGETMTSWEAIGQAFNTQLAVVRPNGLEIDPKACQRRYKALVDSYLSGDLASLRSPGSAEEINEREELIAEVHQAAKEYRSERVERRQSRGSVSSHSGQDVDASSHEEGLATKAAGENAAQIVASLRPVQKRTHEGNGAIAGAMKKMCSLSGDADTLKTWEFMQQYLKEESSRRQQQLRIDEQKLELEKQRFDLERRERECHISTMSAQLELIKQLTQHLEQLKQNPSEAKPQEQII